MIIGAGAAGFNLALAMMDDAFFEDKKVLLIDKSSKSENDRFWSYWEKRDGLFDDIISAKYGEGLFVGPTKEHVRFQLGDYRYKTLESGRFYTHAKMKIDEHPGFKLVKAEVLSTDEKEGSVAIKTDVDNYEALHVFDSRVDPGFYSSNSIKIWQHFKGWTIETSKNIFEANTFIMMDFSVARKGHTSFMYILPFSKNKALVEYTFFDHHPLQAKDYDPHLTSYIQNNLGLNKADFRIMDEELGIIPMTDYPFYKDSSKLITKIGTAGSWVKGSTGYSFGNAMRNGAKIVENLKNNQPPGYRLVNGRHLFYDAILLRVLDRYNGNGPDVFHQMFRKNPIERILKFLSEESCFSDELKIMISLVRREFTQVALMKFFGR